MDRFQCAFYLLSFEDLSQPGQIRMPLCQHLVDQTALAHLILDLTALLVPVCFKDALPEQGPVLRIRFQQLLIVKIDALDKIAAVEQIFIHPLFPFFKNPLIFAGILLISQMFRHPPHAF